MDEIYQVTITIIVLVILLYVVLGVVSSRKGEGEREEFEETKKIMVENRIISDEKEKCKNKIPKRIVQTYFSREVPERMHAASLTFKEMNPDYDYIFYDDDDAREFLIKNFDSEVLEAFDILIPGAYKADLFRLCELYINGGFYADIYMMNLKSLDYFDKYDVDCILTKDCNTKSNIYNAFMACKSKNPFIGLLIGKTVENIVKRNIGDNPLDLTGPRFIGKQILKYLNLSEIKSGIIDKLLLLDHEFNGENEKNYVLYENDKIVQTKYKDYRKDRPKFTHYPDLYYAGKIFKN